MLKKLKKFLLVVLFLGATIIFIDVKFLSINRLKVKEVVLDDSQIPQSFDKSKILIFSDVYGDEKQLQKVVKQVDEIKPDFIIFLGNLFEKQDDDIKLIQKSLESMEAPLGKFSILGEKDYDYDLESLKQLYSDTGFRLIENDILQIHRFEDEYIHFAFIDRFGSDMENVLADQDTFTLSFSHSPNVINRGILFSGKTMNGKVNIPLIGSIYFQNEPTKFHTKSKNLDLYLSGGVGTNNPKIRFLADPNIIVVELKSSK